ncbi:hypothetical protein scyTo_0015754, partial [Scyliorhinus torazame]|nr:hypothetical protein [Scyliorhinus torazame]
DTGLRPSGAGGRAANASPKLLTSDRRWKRTILAAGASTVLGNVQEGPNVERHYLNQSGQQYYTPEVSAFDGPDDLLTQLESQIYGSSTELQTRTDFTLKSFQPKVQVPFYVPPGQRPRKLEIERRRRQYQNQNLKQLLKLEGINSDKLMPRHSGPERNRAKTGKNAPHFTVYLPLEVFDDEEFECRTPEEWLQLGYEEGSDIRKPIPAKALLPKDD